MDELPEIITEEVQEPATNPPEEVEQVVSGENSEKTEENNDEKSPTEENTDETETSSVKSSKSSSSNDSDGKGETVTPKLRESSIRLALATLRSRVSQKTASPRSKSPSPGPSGGIQAELLMGNMEDGQKGKEKKIVMSGIKDTLAAPGFVRPLRPLLPKPPVLVTQSENLEDLNTPGGNHQLIRAKTVNVPVCNVVEETVTTVSTHSRSSTGSSRRKNPPLIVTKFRHSLAANSGESPVSVVNSGITDRPRMSAGFDDSKSPPNNHSDPDIEILESEETDGSVLSNAYLEKCLNSTKQDNALEHLMTRPPGLEIYKFERAPPDVIASLASSKVFNPDGYPCLDCGDEYALKSSLEFHLERRVQNIAAFCKNCAKIVHFLNRCRFLEHARNHTLKPELCYERIRVFALRPADIDKAFEQWYACAACVRLSDLVALSEYEFGEKPKYLDYDKSERKTVVQPDVVTVPDMTETDTNRFCCTECKVWVTGKENLRRHFVYNLPQNQRQIICQAANCSAVYFSKCSFRAHSRTHREQQTPFTCAECGLQQTSSVGLNKHLLEHRTAPTVLNAWRCIKCSMFYSNWQTVVVHTAVAHCHFVFKCPGCNSAFQDTNSCADHVRKEHPMLKYNADTSGHVQKCLQCDKMFKNREELTEHLKAHLNALEPFKIFRCPLCGRLLENKMGLVAHFARSHRIQLSMEEIYERLVVNDATIHTQSDTETRKRPAQDNLTETVQLSSKRRTDVYKCPKCPKELSNDFLLRLHMKMEHGENLRPEELKSTNLAK